MRQHMIYQTTTVPCVYHITFLAQNVYIIFHSTDPERSGLLKDIENATEVPGG